MKQIRVPGKLMIAGEYAVLEPNQHAIVIAINKYVTATIERSSENHLSLPQLGFYHLTWQIKEGEIVFSNTDPKLHLIQQAIRLMEQFLREKGIIQHPYKLTISSELDDKSGKKYGLGSSAAIVVAVITSIFSLYNGRIHYTLEEIFKLSAMTHLLVQGNGSGADIAASTYGGWLDYCAFRSEWVLKELSECEYVSELVRMPWPHLSISHLNAPTNLKLCVGWTGEIARTGPMVEKIKKFSINNPKLYQQFLLDSAGAVSNLIESFHTNNLHEIMFNIEQNRKALMTLSKNAGVPIETNKLKILCDIATQYGSGKSSGAGGGDCGIAFVSSRDHFEQLSDKWEKSGIVPLDLNVSGAGVIVN